MLASSALLVFSALLPVTQAQILPTVPGPNETYAADSICTIAWSPDTSGTWTNVTIDLMSGSNYNMSFVTNVATGLDGTNKSLTPYQWTCPEVAPYSAIYFYQFTNGDDISTRKWTTRFTIASPTNQTTPPMNAQQPDGDAVPWGVGRLGSSKDLASAVITGSQSSNSVGENEINPTTTQNAVTSSDGMTDAGSTGVYEPQLPKPPLTSEVESNSSIMSSPTTPMPVAMPEPTEANANADDDAHTHHAHKGASAPMDAGSDTNTDPKVRPASSASAAGTREVAHGQGATTHTANIPAAKSQAARVSAVAGEGDYAPNNDDDNGSGSASASAVSGRNDRSGTRSAGDQAQEQPASASESEAGCRCYTAENAGQSSRLIVTGSPLSSWLLPHVGCSLLLVMIFML